MKKKDALEIDEHVPIIYLYVSDLSVGFTYKSLLFNLLRQSSGMIEQKT